MSHYELPSSFVEQINKLGELQRIDGSVAADARREAQALAVALEIEAPRLARMFGQDDYARALAADFKSWVEKELAESPDFSRSRDALLPPADGMPFFFAGPLRLANGGRQGWRMECFLALREEPENEEYKSIYRIYPHPKNICQSSHLLSGSQGLMTGNNIVFFPENIQASAPLINQAYAVFFFNKFYEIYRSITLRRVEEATDGTLPIDSTERDARATYLARCVWGYLHDYFHHQGRRPFDQHVSIKTRWYTGLLEETKVDLQTWLACREEEFIDSDAVAEFILFDRAFRYPSEPDWFRNFDSGTGLLLLSLLESKGGLAVRNDGRISIKLDRIPAIARDFIAEVDHIENLPDEDYICAAKEMVRRYLPEGPQGQRIGLPKSLSASTISDIVGSSVSPIVFDSEILSRSLATVDRRFSTEFR